MVLRRQSLKVDIVCLLVVGSLFIAVIAALTTPAGQEMVQAFARRRDMPLENLQFPLVFLGLMLAVFLFPTLATLLFRFDLTLDIDLPRDRVSILSVGLIGRRSHVFPLSDVRMLLKPMEHDPELQYLSVTAPARPGAWRRKELWHYWIDDGVSESISAALAPFMVRTGPAAYVVSAASRHA